MKTVEFVGDITEIITVDIRDQGTELKPHATVSRYSSEVYASVRFKRKPKNFKLQAHGLVAVSSKQKPTVRILGDLDLLEEINENAYYFMNYFEPSPHDKVSILAVILPYLWVPRLFVNKQFYNIRSIRIEGEDRIGVLFWSDHHGDFEHNAMRFDKVNEHQYYSYEKPTQVPFEVRHIKAGKAKRFAERYGGKIIDSALSIPSLFKTEENSS